jgi:hypothetical protein
MSDLTFFCRYCRGKVAAGPEQAECMIVCPHCGRNVMVPLEGNDLDWDVPPPRPRRRFGPVVFTAIWALLGGIVVGGLAFAFFYWVSLSFIGVSAYSAGVAGCIGFAVGAFPCGLLAWGWTAD